MDVKVALRGVFLQSREKGVLIGAERGLEILNMEIPNNLIGIITIKNLDVDLHNWSLENIHYGVETYFGEDDSDGIYLCGVDIY